MDVAWLPDFETRTIEVDATSIHARVGGAGLPLLLLHGFPETHLMWRDVAPRLAEQFTVVCADLPGQGDSGCPASGDDHFAHSKRAMAKILVTAMYALGFDHFAAVGHDRGGRVAYRMALDHPGKIDAVAVLDIVPILDAWDHADARLAIAFWPWSLLAQPSPLPERMLTGAADAVVDDAATHWGTPADCFPDAVRQAFAAPLRDPDHAHAICEEFRAAATVDRDHDRADRETGRTIACPLLALWDEGGSLPEWYAPQGGPLAIWRRWAPKAEGHGVAGGHFFPEARPAETADRLAGFLSSKISRTGC